MIRGRFCRQFFLHLPTESIPLGPWLDAFDLLNGKHFGGAERKSLRSLLAAAGFS
jgi:hypothetical protein